MPPHDERIPADLKPERIIRALCRLGFRVDGGGGKGSHVKLVWTNEKMIIVQRNLHRGAIRGLLREIENISGLCWGQIKEEY